MQTQSDDQALVGSPRGRRLCAEVAEALIPELRATVRAAIGTSESSPEVAAVVRVLRSIDVADVNAISDRQLLGHLSKAIGFAWYWQYPVDTDVVYGLSSVRTALAPIATAITGAHAARWWDDPVALDAQRYVQRFDQKWFTRPVSGGSGGLARWLATTVAEENRARRDRPADPAANFSGKWWSTPAFSGALPTTRSSAWLGALNLELIEDALGWDRARIWPVEVIGDPRIFEITGPSDWAHLVEAYPLSVTASRRHDWYRTTSRSSEWLIPNWSAVAADYDAVHLTVNGYLTTPGVAIDVPGGATVLAGWNPDETYWLTGVHTTLADEPAEWFSDKVDRTWHPGHSAFA